MIAFRMGLLALAALAIIVALVVFRPKEACATEYDLSAYLADPDDLARIIGCADAAFADRLVAASLASEMRLDQRFRPAETWKDAVRAFVDGRPRGNDAAEGFAIRLAVDAVGEPADPPFIGAPFTELESAAIAVRVAGAAELATYLARIDEGNIAADMTGLPPPLRGKLEPSNYPLRVSVFAPDDARRFATLLDAWEGIPDDAIDRLAAHEAEYWDPDGGMEMAVSLLYDKDTLVGWLEAAAESGKTLFLFYESF